MCTLTTIYIIYTIFIIHTDNFDVWVKIRHPKSYKFYSYNNIPHFWHTARTQIYRSTKTWKWFLLTRNYTVFLRLNAPSNTGKMVPVTAVKIGHWFTGKVNQRPIIYKYMALIMIGRLITVYNPRSGWIVRGVYLKTYIRIFRELGWTCSVHIM